MRNRFLFAIIGLFLLSLLAAGFFAYRSVFSSEAIARREVSKWVSLVGKAVELPRSETPTLATVTNSGKLGDQPLFRDAENGDKILIYPVAGRAYLYRPATGKLVGIADLVIETDGAAI